MPDPDTQAAAPVECPEKPSAAEVPDATVPEAAAPVAKIGELELTKKKQIEQVTASLQRLNTADIQASSLDLSLSLVSLSLSLHLSNSPLSISSVACVVRTV